MLVAGALIVLTLPLLVLVAFAIKCDSSGPIIARQERVGARGQRFTALKFRTTHHYSVLGPADWRVDRTRIGWFLRYTRIENIPQLVNVLRGEMSCLNPRSECPFFLD
jgi:lipopolysaccharide/colanic/teichoic acid biosynthesis glycosyltransferase